MILTRARNSNRGGSANDTSNEWLVDVPGLVRSEIRTVLMAGNILVHAEKTATKGKGKENAFDDPLLPSKPLNEKVELPFGVQVRIFSYLKTFSPSGILNVTGLCHLACGYSGKT